MSTDNKPQNSLINPDVIVIGAGMTGSIITKFLRSKGLQILLIDNKKPMAASKCSSGMWRDGWVNEKIRDFYTAGLEVLHEFAGIEFVNCLNMDIPAKDTKKAEKIDPVIDELMFVNYKHICDVEAANYEVVSITGRVVTCVHPENGQHNERRHTQFIATKKVFICAGAYTDDILVASGYTPIGIDKYFGSAIETVNRQNEFEMSRIRTWAPYKQFLAARVSPTILRISDGSLVKNPSPQGDERCDRAHNRLKEHIQEYMGRNFKLDGKYTRELFGLRPYLPKDKDDFVTKHASDLYSFTGTAKNTTILCGYLALRAWEILSGEDWKLNLPDRNEH